MWLVALFDLPVGLPSEKRDAAKFRKLLIKEGFSMLQFSVYAQYFVSEEASAPVKGRLRANLPPRGEVRFLALTDHQFGKMEVFLARELESAETPPDQMRLF